MGISILEHLHTVSPLVRDHLRLCREGDIVLEIGVFAGGSLARWAAICEDLGQNRRIIGVDPFDHDIEYLPKYNFPWPYNGETLQAMTAAAISRYGNVEIQKKTSDAFFADYDGPKIAFAMIDGDHAPAVAQRDFLNCMKHIGDHCMIAIDDVQESELEPLIRSYEPSWSVRFFPVYAPELKYECQNKFCVMVRR